MGVLGPGGVAGETVTVSVTGEPYVDVAGVTVRTEVIGRAVTTSEQDAELPSKASVGT